MMHARSILSSSPPKKRSPSSARSSTRRPGGIVPTARFGGGSAIVGGSHATSREPIPRRVNPCGSNLQLREGYYERQGELLRAAWVVWITPAVAEELASFEPRPASSEEPHCKVGAPPVLDRDGTVAGIVSYVDVLRTQQGVQHHQRKKRRSTGA